MYKTIHRLFIAAAGVSLLAVAGAAPANAEKSCVCVKCTWVKGRAEFLYPTAEEARANEETADLEAAYELNEALQAKGPPVCQAPCALVYSSATHGPPYSGGGGRYPNVYAARSPWSVTYTCQKLPLAPPAKVNVRPGGKLGPEPKKADSRKAGVTEDNPSYMQNYTPPASTKPKPRSKTGDSGHGPPPRDDKTDDKTDDNPSNDKQPEIPIPH